MICEKFHEFKEGTDFVAWACQIAYWRVRYSRQKFARSKVVFDQDIVDVVAQTAGAMTDELDDRHEALAACLQKLHPRDRELLIARYEPGGGVEEAARRSGRTRADRLQGAGAAAQAAAGLRDAPDWRTKGGMNLTDTDILELNELCNAARRRHDHRQAEGRARRSGSRRPETRGSSTSASPACPRACCPTPARCRPTQPDARRGRCRCRRCDAGCDRAARAGGDRSPSSCRIGRVPGRMRPASRDIAAAAGPSAQRRRTRTNSSPG